MLNRNALDNPRNIKKIYEKPKWPFQIPVFKQYALAERDSFYRILRLSKKMGKLQKHYT